MIVGAVDAMGDAVVELTIAGADQYSARLPFVVDTGFSGDVTLPAELADALDLRFTGMGHTRLGDGSLSNFPIREASIRWDGVTRIVEVEVSETEPLLGMRLLDGHELRIDVLPGGTVTITAIQQRRPR